MDHLNHDPRTKQTIKEELYNFLYSPVQREFRARLDSLILKNTIACGYGHRSFVYKGNLYSSEDTLSRTRNKLAPQFRQEMEDYLSELSALNTEEMSPVITYINQVLNASNDFGDYFKLLPEACHPILQKIVDSCPCRNSKLSQARVEKIQQNNQKPIALLKRRLVHNLLI
ncbi:hypothetical protein [Xenophilus sp. Marseille-Q4582]|uniref:hypothetical protein n=1 Tax=Xenophilus sp. Marseille-Q4582 TaxID=2866600 RepID=UPI001CE3BE7A|nr:hypothetical protein [Xenophilus sp. Marseille-Q4582]